LAARAFNVTDEAARNLRVVRLLHTLVWAVFAGCIATIPVLAVQSQFRAGAVLAAIVLGEVVVLWLNGWRCPLTDVAARYTQDRRANFDIYLPEWLARYNKQIFGPLYGVGLVVLAIRWMSAS
jgi:hypothetical protein